MITRFAQIVFFLLFGITFFVSFQFGAFLTAVAALVAAIAMLANV